MSTARGMQTPTEQADHYRAWASADCVTKFAAKDRSDFFASETHFLDRIGPTLESVLDIGCASGRLIELLHTYRTDLDYTGIDLVPAGIEAARRRYPQHRFAVTNALDFASDRTFDLVNATGVVQHEPRFVDLIVRMLDWSDRFVLFDCKLSGATEHLVDRDRSHVTIEGDRLYFNVLSFSRFIDWLGELRPVGRVHAFGYETAPNDRTMVPVEFLPMASVGVLLDKRPDPAGVRAVLDVPGFLTADGSVAPQQP